MKNNQPGFIMVLVLFILSIAVALSVRLFNTGMVHSFFIKTATDREKAQWLAQGGVQLALSTLALNTSATGQQDPAAQEKALLEAILPAINRLQTFELKEAVEGIDATVGFCITCEEGKLNLNNLYDFKEKKFKFGGQEQDAKKLMSALASLKLFAGDVDLMTALEKWFKERGRPLDDVTELYSIKEFATAFKEHTFYVPPSKGDEKRPVYLEDLFTVDTKTNRLQPWLLSDSWCAVFGLRRAGAADAKAREGEVKTWLKEFKTMAQWSTDWDKILKPVYGKDFAALPKDSEPLLSTQFGAQTFSVIGYGTVGVVTKRVCAVVQRNTAQKGKGSSFVIKRTYLL